MLDRFYSATPKLNLETFAKNKRNDYISVSVSGEPNTSKRNGFVFNVSNSNTSLQCQLIR